MKYRTDDDTLNISGSPFELLGEQVKAVADDLTGYRRDMDRVHDDISNLRAQVKGMYGGAAATMGTLAGRLGRSGAEDFCKGLGDIARQVIASAKGRRQDGNVDKAADLMSISADERGGYVVPDSYASELDHVLSAYGGLIGRCRLISQEAGRPFHIPYLSTKPEAAWVTTEGGNLTEMDVAIAEKVLTPRLLGGWISASNELMNTSAVDFGAIFANAMVEAVAEALEDAIIAGDDSGGLIPSDGLLVMSGTNSQSALATATQGNLLTFVTEAVSDFSGHMDSGSILIMSPAVYLTALGNSVGSGYSSSLFTQGASGQPKFNRWDVVTSPAAVLSGPAHYVMLVDPRNLYIPRWNWSVDVDPFGLFTANKTRLRALVHANYGMAQPSACSKAAVTALS